MSLKDGFPVNKSLQEWITHDNACPFKTVSGVFMESVRRWGKCPYLGKREGKQFVFKTYNEVLDDVLCFASNLIELGLEKEERVANYSTNSIEWVTADLGTAFIGGVHVPMYPTLSQSEMAYIVKDCGARMVVVSDKDHLEKVLNVANDCSYLRHVVCIGQFDREKITIPDGVRVWRWEDFISAGRNALKMNRNQIDRMFRAVKPDDVFTIVYTSGTTGNPKGAMLLHANFVCLSVPLAAEVLNAGPADRQLSFLPLSHVFERCVHYAMMCSGSAVGFSKSIATVTSDMIYLKPTIIPSVPRLFEKIFAKVLEQSAAGGLRSKVFQKAIKIGREYREAAKKGKVPLSLRMEHAVYDKLVYSKVREKLGGEVRYFISGGAPIRCDVANFFADVGLCILEGYGLTETASVLAVNRPGRVKIGTVGEVPNNIEVKVADDGEIIARGPSIMLGYFGRPDATAEMIDSDGWLHTGDIGDLDEDGCLSITDRKKEIIVLSNGKNVAPQPIELSLCSDLFIAQAVVIGNNRGYVTALLVPNFDKLEKWAADKKIGYDDREELVKLPVTVSLYKEIVRKVCEPLSNYENIRKIHILGRELSMAAGEVTPTLKVKRRIIDEHFKAEIAAMYVGDTEAKKAK